MKIFQTIQKSLSYLGISWFYSIQKYPINGLNVLAFSVLSIESAKDCVYLCHVATTFKNYADSIYACLSIIDGTVFFAVVIWRMQIFFDCMNRIEKITNESKFYIKKKVQISFILHRIKFKII